MSLEIQDSSSPAHGQQVITACAFITHDFDGITKVFLPKRADTKKFLPGLYELPGGHIDFNEDIVDGLQREVYEEISMNISVGDPFACFTYNNILKGSHSIEVVYFAKFVEPINQIKLNIKDHSRYDWFTREEVIAHKPELTPASDHASYKAGDDPEYVAILKGFDLFEGKSLKKA